jgi:multidrug efflux pump
VFLPMAFFGGSTGVIYKQFSLTIVSAMVLSVLIALVLSPALTSTLLRNPHQKSDTPSWFDRRFPTVGKTVRRGQSWFNNSFKTGVVRYEATVVKAIDRKWLSLGIYALIVLLLIVMFVRLPTSFLPTEDQGAASIQFRLPPGATQQRTLEVRDRIENYLQKEEGKNIKTMFLVAGGGRGASGQNTGRGFINFVNWDERPGKENTADAIVARMTKAFRGLRDAQVFALVPGAVRGLGQSNGFTMELLNSSGLSREAFLAGRDKLLELANADPKLESLRLSDLPDVATLKVDIDQQRLGALGLNAGDVNSTLATAWGGRYVNDFVDQGRVKRVYVQGDEPYRSDPGSLSQWYVRGDDGQMSPFSAFATTGWSTGPSSLSRFQGFPAFEFQGQAAAGISSGEAMDRMAELAAQIPGTTVAWAGASYEERQSSGQAPLLYALSLLVVFLCLAALYES